MVGMRPLERSLEKLDDVRRKKLSEMIAGSGDGVAAVGTSGGCIHVHVAITTINLEL
jgi:cytoskeleton-associated protein 5